MAPSHYTTASHAQGRHDHGRLMPYALRSSFSYLTPRAVEIHESGEVNNLFDPFLRLDKSQFYVSENARVNHLPTVVSSEMTSIVRFTDLKMGLGHSK